MEGIFLTEEGKKAIEDKIAELEETYREYASWEEKYGELQTLKEILESAIILPVEKSWENVIDMHGPEGACNKYYPNGLIIQPKQ